MMAQCLSNALVLKIGCTLETHGALLKLMCQDGLLGCWKYSIF